MNFVAEKLKIQGQTRILILRPGIRHPRMTMRRVGFGEIESYEIPGLTGLSDYAREYGGQGKVSACSHVHVYNSYAADMRYEQHIRCHA